MSYINRIQYNMYRQYTHAYSLFRILVHLCDVLSEVLENKTKHQGVLSQSRNFLALNIFHFTAFQEGLASLSYIYIFLVLYLKQKKKLAVDRQIQQQQFPLQPAHENWQRGFPIFHNLYRKCHCVHRDFLHPRQFDPLSLP